MAVKSTFGEGGGKFNNIDGVIKDYTYTTVNPFSKGGPSTSEFKPLYAVLTARMDGKSVDDVDVMLVGSAEDFEIENNGKAIVPVKKGGKIWKHSQWSKFIETWEETSTLGAQTEKGEADYVEDGFSYEAILGSRVRFGQVTQFDKGGNVKTRKGSDGKTYNDTTTVVTAYYDKIVTPATQAVKTTKAATKPNGKAIEVDLTAEADQAIGGLLAKFGGSAPKAKLVSAQAQMFLKQNYAATADELRKVLYDDDYLRGAVERGVISGFDQTDKAMTITA